MQKEEETFRGHGNREIGGKTNEISLWLVELKESVN
jgi:hypothetical protein